MERVVGVFGWMCCGGGREDWDVSLLARHLERCAGLL
jgi:hypothetical protein